jgi:uncharacterized protein (TIGR03066 family)
MKKVNVVVVLLIMLAFAACKPYIDANKLVGRWHYVKVEKAHVDLPDTVSRAELEDAKPYIEFANNGNVTIMWGGKILSHGKYKIDGKNIVYTESLPGGKTRTFPYYVTQFTDKEITFETTDDDGSRVKAIKE